MSLTDRVKWINHNGKKIILTDFTGLVGQDLITVLEEYRRYLLTRRYLTVIMRHI